MARLHGLTAFISVLFMPSIVRASLQNMGERSLVSRALRLLVSLAMR